MKAILTTLKGEFLQQDMMLHACALFIIEDTGHPAP